MVSLSEQDVTLLDMDPEHDGSRFQAMMVVGLVSCASLYKAGGKRFSMRST